MKIQVKKEWIGILILLVVLSLIFWTRGVPELEVPNNPVMVASTIKVYIHGEVVTPGVYTLDEDARLEELLALAGGFKETADTKHVNLARPMEDGEMITIYPVSQVVVYRGIDRFNYGEKSEIMALDGIGETLATRIIAYREAHGFFQNYQDLLKVDGIGESKLKHIEDALEE